MKLYEHLDGWNALAQGDPAPAVRMRDGVSVRLALLPYVRERVKLHARALVHRSHTQRLLRLLNSHPAFADYARHCPRLLHKIYRPYLSANLAMGERLAVLASHYQFMFRHGLAQTVAQASRGRLLLASVAGKTGVRYQVHLRAVEPMEREGELVLQLSQGEQLVYSTAFTFSDLEGEAMVSIGCIQGPKHGDGLGAIRDATRELHGLRPKQLMVSLVRQLGYELGCSHMRMVGNANRVVRGAMREGRVLADYDQLWNELGAQRRGDGDYQLRCTAQPALDLERICSKKRSEARKRHALASELSAAVARHFCGRPGVPMHEHAGVARWGQV
ncbi:MAG: DUF535 family protein [Pseudomonadota bacterium]|nr:DUF535 family protein [Pseudomonadota bacterium]